MTVDHETDAPPQLLPQSHFLSYVASADSPTHVRRIAARAILIMCFVELLIPVFAASVEISIIHDDLWGKGGFWDYLMVVRDSIWTYGGAFAASFAPSVVHFICAGGIRRGKKVPALLSWIFLIPLMLAGLAGGTLLLVVALTGLEADRHVFLWWAAPAILCVLGVLVLKDIGGFLLWIFRRPISEKPPLPWIPIQ